MDTLCFLPLNTRGPSPTSRMVFPLLIGVWHRYAPGDRIPRRAQIQIYERVHEAVCAKKAELVGERDTFSVLASIVLRAAAALLYDVGGAGLEIIGWV